jgi:hypothetical protein
VLLSVHTWFVKSPHHTILIDTGIGNDKNRPTIPVMDHLQEPYLISSALLPAFGEDQTSMAPPVREEIEAVFKKFQEAYDKHDPPPFLENFLFVGLGESYFSPLPSATTVEL